MEGFNGDFCLATVASDDAVEAYFLSLFPLFSFVTFVTVFVFFDVDLVRGLDFSLDGASGVFSISEELEGSDSSLSDVCLSFVILVEDFAVAEFSALGFFDTVLVSVNLSFLLSGDAFFVVVFLLSGDFFCGVLGSCFREGASLSSELEASFSSI